jgi:catechol 2,3-dioxygenase-like lactoylglutathione lyase family enzyme
MDLRAANITVMVEDLDRAADFYTRMLGFAVVAREGDFFVELRAPGVAVVLHPRRPGVRSGAASELRGVAHVSIGLDVDDLGTAAAKLRAGGVAHETFENAANAFVSFRDPDGTSLYFRRDKRG